MNSLTFSPFALLRGWELGLKVSTHFRVSSDSPIWKLPQSCQSSIQLTSIDLKDYHFGDVKDFNCYVARKQIEDQIYISHYHP